MMMNKIHGKVTGLVCIALLSVAMSGSAVAGCSGTQLVSSCAQATPANCANSYENMSGTPYQCVKMQSGKAAGLCGIGVLCPKK